MYACRAQLRASLCLQLIFISSHVFDCIRHLFLKPFHTVVSSWPTLLMCQHSSLQLLQASRGRMGYYDVDIGKLECGTTACGSASGLPNSVLAPWLGSWGAAFVTSITRGSARGHVKAIHTEILGTWCCQHTNPLTSTTRDYSPTNHPC